MKLTDSSNPEALPVLDNSSPSSFFLSHKKTIANINMLHTDIHVAMYMFILSSKVGLTCKNTYTI